MVLATHKDNGQNKVFRHPMMLQVRGRYERQHWNPMREGVLLLLILFFFPFPCGCTAAVPFSPTVIGRPPRLHLRSALEPHSRPAGHIHTHRHIVMSTLAGALDDTILNGNYSGTLATPEESAINQIHSAIIDDDEPQDEEMQDLFGEDQDVEFQKHDEYVPFARFVV